MNSTRSFSFRLANIAIRSLLVFNLLFSSSFGMMSTAYAATPKPLPDAEALKNQITSDVNNELQSEAQPDAQQMTAEASGNNSQPSGTNETDVVNSGDDTTVESNTNNENNTEVNNNNNANVAQTVDAEANTGFNEAKGNISFGGTAGYIQTGNAVVNVQGSVSANNNTTSTSGGSGGAGSTSSTTNSGNNVTTTTNTNGSRTTTVNNNNRAVIYQAANTRATTGGNTATGNIAIGGGSAGVIITGAALSNVSFMTVANGSATLVGGTGNGSGPGNGADIYITNTGGRFAAFANLENRVNTMVNNNSAARINQTCGGATQSPNSKVAVDPQGGCVSDTGGNESSNGIAFGADAGVIQTGNAVVDVQMDASANHNTTVVGNGGNGASSDTNVINSGDNATVQNNANSQTNTTVNNNNTADVNQNVRARANTGYNKANYNISFGGNAGVIITGHAVVNVLMSTDVNSNETVISSPSADVNGSAGAGAGSTTQVLNTGNKVNVATNTTNNVSTTVNNNNSLDLNQVHNAQVSTGENDASGNIAQPCGCAFSRYACIMQTTCANHAGFAGLIVTGNAFVQSAMGVSANTNVTGDPVALQNMNNNNAPTPTTAPAQPTPTTAPQQQVNAIGGSTTSSTATTYSPVPQGYSVFAAAVKNAVGATIAAQTAKAGKVLGAMKAKGLPATGAEHTVLIVIGAILALFVGARLKKLSLIKESVGKGVKI